jgi:epoxyqueuosine reductase
MATGSDESVGEARLSFQTDSGEPNQGRVLLGRERVRALAAEAGFDEAGLVNLPHSEDQRDAARYEEWIGTGRAGTMDYLKRTSDQGELVRARPHVPFPWARTAIVCMASYHNAHPRSTVTAPDGAAQL